METPKIPILPAIATRIVLFDLENKLAKESLAAVKNDMELFFFLPLFVSSGKEARTPQFGQRSTLPSITAPHFGHLYNFFFSVS